MPVDDDLATRGPLDQRDQSQQGGFAGAGMAGHKHHLAFFDDQAQSPEGIVPAGESLGYVFELNQGNQIP